MNKKRITRDMLADWESIDLEIGDALHFYFGETFCERHWCDIYAEGLSVLELMFGIKVEEFSPAGGIFAAVAAQSAKGAFEAVAGALGVDAKELEIAVSEWNEGKCDFPDPIGYKGLEQEVLDVRKLIASWSNRNA